MVVGPTRVAHSQRDIPAGDSVSGTECDRVHQHAFHVRDSAVVFVHAVHLQVGDILVLLGMGGTDVCLHNLLDS